MSDINQQVILAAFQAAGPQPAPGPAPDDKSFDPVTEWKQKVRRLIREFTIALGDSSAEQKTITSVSGPNTKVFRSTIVRVSLEKSSKRAIISLKGRPTEQNPSGEEQVRTERTDNVDGMSMARLARSLKGHDVTLWVEIEQMAKDPNKKVRILRHLEDNGVAETEGAD
ncbi:hypothetical protein [Agromyces subbeticus]|uniref:hypothetical protein n=1 Tax=Agromyces subbeticus TaxID=293890 RepID=UPI0003B2FEDE|nr:hypothetical protein [Agromyces subbeticus]